MKRSSWIAVVALCALTVACEKHDADDMDDAPSAEEMAAVRTAIDAANAEVIVALNAGDVAKWASHYADDAIVMMANSPAWRGRAEFEAGAKAMFAYAAMSDFKVTTEDVLLSGDIAVESGSNEMTMTPTGGKPMTDKGKYVTTWKRQADGSWKIVRDIMNSNLPMTM